MFVIGMGIGVYICSWYGFIMDPTWYSEFVALFLKGIHDICLMWKP